MTGGPPGTPRTGGPPGTPGSGFPPGAPKPRTKTTTDLPIGDQGQKGLAQGAAGTALTRAQNEATHNKNQTIDTSLFQTGQSKDQLTHSQTQRGIAADENSEAIGKRLRHNETQTLENNQFVLDQQNLAATQEHGRQTDLRDLQYGNAKEMQELERLGLIATRGAADQQRGNLAEQSWIDTAFLGAHRGQGQRTQSMQRLSTNYADQSNIINTQRGVEDDNLAARSRQTDATKTLADLQADERLLQGQDARLAANTHAATQLGETTQFGVTEAQNQATATKNAAARDTTFGQGQLDAAHTNTVTQAQNQETHSRSQAQLTYSQQMQTIEAQYAGVFQLESDLFNFLDQHINPP